MGRSLGGVLVWGWWWGRWVGELVVLWGVCGGVGGVFVVGWWVGHVGEGGGLGVVFVMG